MMSTLAASGTPGETSGGINMKSVVFYNNKGGVGKTTFAVHCVQRSIIGCERLRSDWTARGTSCAGSQVARCGWEMARCISTVPT